MDDTFSLLQVTCTPFRSHNLYVTFSKLLNGDFPARLLLTHILTNLNGNMGAGDTSMAQVLCKHPVLYSDFGDSNRPRISEVHVSFLDFETSYTALFNGLTSSDIRILILNVYFSLTFFQVYINEVRL